MEEKIRCFIALELPLDFRKEIVKTQDLIRRKNFFTGKFTGKENLHLTLKFLGEIDENKVKEVKERLKKVKFNEFEAYSEGIGVFDKKIIRIIWLQLKNIIDHNLNTNV
jgi:2'-5' RNA ligase